MRAASLTLFAVIGLGISGFLKQLDVPPASDAPVPTAKPYGLGKPPFAQLSSSSCAASSCHGGGAVGKKGSEHSTWAPEVFPEGAHDPHANAYRVLFNADSVRIGKYLKIGAPHKEALCLKCHAVEEVKPADAISEAVGCGACHGPAEKWLGAHVAPGWTSLSNQDKWEKYGFVPAGNLVARSLNCAGCHVGDADKEVNHDLIAAGHPRLNFEYTRFHFSPKYRKHWEEKTPQPDFEVRAWITGQAATLRAATDLLRIRAERAAIDDTKTPWPEFSGLSCYACHQQIGLEGPQRGTADKNPKRPAGVAGWEVWSNTASDTAAKFCPDAFPDVNSPQLPHLNVLRKLMEKRNPNPKTIAEAASKAVAELDAWLAGMQVSEDRNRPARVSPYATERIAHALAANALSKDRTKLADHDWDALSANYLGSAAMYHAAGGRGNVPGWTTPIHGLTADLKFPIPKAGGEGFNSPAGFGRKERDRVRDRFRELFDATGGLREKP